MEDITEKSQIPVIFSIDVEPDEFLIDKNNPKKWSGFEFCHGYLSDVRNKLEDITNRPVNFNWFLRFDPQIAISYGSATWVLDHYAHWLEEYRGKGDKFGLHVHTYRYSNELDGWIDDIGNKTWVEECLGSSAAFYQEYFKEPAPYLRFGGFFIDTAAINVAEKLGIKYDLSVEPGIPGKKVEGSNIPRSAPTPDFYRVPRVPYRPAIDDCLKPAGKNEHRDITLIPLSTAHLKLGYGYKDWRARLGRVVRNGVSGYKQSLPLSMWREWEGSNTYAIMLERAIELQNRPFLAVAIRSSIDGWRFKNYTSSFNGLFECTSTPDFNFCSPEKAMEWLS